MRNNLPENIIGFLLKPDAISKDVVILLEKELIKNNFEIKQTCRRKLDDNEIDILHCVNGPWKADVTEYKKYMKSGDSIAYLVKHKVLVGTELFYFGKRLRGTHIIAQNCEQDSLRRKIYELMTTNKGTSYKPLFSCSNYVHVTDNHDELQAFIQLYFLDQTNLDG